MAEASSRTFTASTAREGCAASSEPASASTATNAQRSEINPEPPAAAVPVILLIRPADGENLQANSPCPVLRRHCADFAALARLPGVPAPLSVGKRSAHFQRVSTILPICALVSISAWAAAASFEREGLEDHRLDLARRDQRQRIVLDRARDRTFVGVRARAQRRAGVMQPLEHEAHEIDLRLRAALECDLHDAALHRGRFVIARDVIAADHVQYNVGALVAGGRFGGRDEVLGFIVNGDVGAELAAGRAFFRRAGGGDDARAERLGELDRGGADAGGAAMHQKSFAAFETAALHHVVPDGEEGLRDRRGLDHRQSADRQRVACLREAIFGIAAADHQRHHAVADFPALDVRLRAPRPRRRSPGPEYPARRAAADRGPGAASRPAG